jgi:hypothetical protein
MTFLRPSNIEDRRCGIVANDRHVRHKARVWNLTILRIGIIGAHELSDEKWQITRGAMALLVLARRAIISPTNIPVIERSIQESRPSVLRKTVSLGIPELISQWREYLWRQCSPLPAKNENPIIPRIISHFSAQRSPTPLWLGLRIISSHTPVFSLRWCRLSSGFHEGYL